MSKFKVGEEVFVKQVTDCPNPTPYDFQRAQLYSGAHRIKRVTSTTLGNLYLIGRIAFFEEELLKTGAAWFLEEPEDAKV